MVKGGVLPFGGHKGFGLSLMIQALGLLGGAAAPGGETIDRGFLFIVFDPALLLPRETFKAEIRKLISRVKALPKQPGVEEIRIPSERGYRERAQNRAAGGFTIDQPVYDRLVNLGRVNR